MFTLWGHPQYLFKNISACTLTEGCLDILAEPTDASNFKDAQAAD